MKKTYVVKGDHWQENFNSYAVFHESESAGLALLSTCLAASSGSGWVRRANLVEWNQDEALTSLTLNYGPSGDFSIELRKEKGRIVIDLEGKELAIEQEVFGKIIAAWEEAVEVRPVCVELTQEHGKYAMLTSRGMHITIE